MALFDNPTVTGFTDFLGGPGGNFLSDLGFGLATSTNWKQGLQNTAIQAQKMQPMRFEQAKENRQASASQAFLEKKHPHLLPLLAAGYSPAEVLNVALKEDAQAKKDEEERVRWAQGAQLITNPELRAGVESGQIPLMDAYRFERDGTDARNISTQTGYFKDPVTGEIVLGQAADDGSIVRTETGGLVPLSPFDINSARAAGTAMGKGAGQTALDLPTVEAQSEFAIRNLEGLIYQQGPNGQVLTDETGAPMPNRGMEEQFGSFLGMPTGQYLPAVKGTEKANFQTRLDQVQGQAFLQAIESLKGSGAVSEVEGTKATQAIMRASTASSQDEFIAAVNEAKEIYERGLENARRQAAASPGQVPAGVGSATGASGASGAITATNPSTGEIVTWDGSQWVAQ